MNIGFNYSFLTIFNFRETLLGAEDYDGDGENSNKCKNVVLISSSKHKHEFDVKIESYSNNIKQPVFPEFRITANQKYEYQLVEKRLFKCVEYFIFYIFFINFSATQSQTLEKSLNSSDKNKSQDKVKTIYQEPNKCVELDDPKKSFQLLQKRLFNMFSFLYNYIMSIFLEQC